MAKGFSGAYEGGLSWDAFSLGLVGYISGLHCHG